MTLEVPLRWSGPVRVARIEGVTGSAEITVLDATARSAIRFVDALLPVGAGEGAASRGDAADLAVADRDRILAAIHRMLFGDRVDSSPTCRDCGHRYDLSFSLDDLERHREPERPVPPSDEVPVYSVGSISFRPITGRDEIAALDAGDHEGIVLFQRSVVGDDPQARDGAVAVDTRRDVSEALDREAPLLATQLSGTCPECGKDQRAGFDIQRFLLTRLLDERPDLWNAVHLIASRYHWARRDILTLDRTERQAYARLISGQGVSRRTGGEPS